ncbi:MAG: hypothetical protein ACYC55_00170 [Candidatus Geothermincolia bacterium]
MKTLFESIVCEPEGAERLQMRLHPGLNTIDAGAARLAVLERAIAEALFGKEALPAGRNGTPAIARVELEGRSGERNWRILRTGTSVLATEEGQVIKPDRVSDRLTAWLGTDAAQYLRLALATGRDLSANPEAMIMPTLIQLLGTESLDDLRETEHKLDILLRGRATGDGEPGLPELQAAIKMAQTRVAGLTQDGDKRALMWQQAGEIEEAIEACELRQRSLEEQLETRERWNAAATELEQMEKKLGFLERMLQGIEEGGEVAVTSGALFDMDPEEAVAVLGEMGELEEEAIQDSKEAERLKTQLRMSRASAGPLKRAGAPATMAGMMLCIFGILGSFFNINLIFAFFGGLPVLVFGLQRMQRYHEKAIDADDRSAARQLARIRVRAEHRSARREKLMRRLGCEDREEFDSLMAVMRGESSAPAGMMAEEPHAELTSERLAGEVEAMRARLDGARAEFHRELAEAPILTEVESLVAAYKECREERERLEAAMLRARTSLADSGHPEPELARLRWERLLRAEQQTQAEIERLTSESERLSLELADAVAAALTSLEARVGTFIDRLTRGVYSKVRIASDGAAIEVFSGARGEYIIPAEAGNSVERGLLLALRLALFDTIFSRSNPPLVLLDPMEGLTAQMAEGLRALLEEMGRGRQILLLQPAIE